MLIPISYSFSLIFTTSRENYMYNFPHWIIKKNQVLVVLNRFKIFIYGILFIYEKGTEFTIDEYPPYSTHLQTLFLH